MNKSTGLSQDLIFKMLIPHALKARVGKIISEKYISYNLFLCVIFTSEQHKSHYLYR
jgi:hypothetical protein